MVPKVVCIKVGTAYGPEYVNNLYRMVEANTTVPHEFVCLTDDPVGLECPHKPVDTLFPGWWSKLILFKPHKELVGRRVIFLDLDTIISGNIDFLFDYKGDFAILRDFYHKTQYGSAVMSIAPGYRPDIYRSQIIGFYGDQDWIRHNVNNADLWQEMYPGKIMSYKANGYGWGESIVCFHGKPKPHNLPKDHSLRKIWEGQCQEQPR